jgi:hypothetical protein
MFIHVRSFAQATRLPGLLRFLFLSSFLDSGDDFGSEEYKMDDAISTVYQTLLESCLSA